MNNTHKILLTVALALVAIIFLITSKGGWFESNSSTTSGNTEVGGKIKIAFATDPTGLDPALSQNSEAYAITQAVFNNLVRLDENLEVQPELAVSWENSDDLLTWEFVLQEGVSFHHGKELTAEDVVHTFERILDPEFESPARQVFNFIEDIEATKNNTVVFHLSSPNVEFPLFLAGPQARIVPSDLSSEDLQQAPVGTGPFKFIEFNPGENTKLVRNESYWEQDEQGNYLPYLEEIQHVYIPEEATQIAALISGEVDLLWQVGAQNVNLVENNENTTISETPSGAYQAFAMNITEKPFDNVKVRQAFKAVIDRDAMNEIVTNGLGDPGTDQPIAPIHDVWSGLPTPKRDIDRAKKLLEEAGYPEGIDIDLHTSPSSPGMVEGAVAFQEMAKEAGINVQVKVHSPDVFWSEYFFATPFFVTNWTFRASPNETLTVAHHSEHPWNETRWGSERLDTLIQETRGTVDPEKRKTLYAEAQQIIAEEGATIIPYYLPSITAFRKDLKGFESHPTTWLDLRNAWLD